MWCLSEELVGLELFASRVSVETKKLMINAMEEVVAPDLPSKRPRVKNGAFLSDKVLEKFRTTNSKKLFQFLLLPDTILSEDRSEWEESESFQNALKALNGLAAIDDRTERGVALIKDINKTLTKGEYQLQYMLQVVAVTLNPNKFLLKLHFQVFTITVFSFLHEGNE